MIDLHIHGGFGIDLMAAGPAELDVLASGLSGRGVRAFLPTLVPAPLAEMSRVVGRLATWMLSRREGDGRGAVPLGIHFEGPFVSPRRAGALHASCLLDASDPRQTGPFLELVLSTPGRPMVTLAPEIPGGVALAAELVLRGAVVSIGHTEADVSTLDAALRAGARHMTHFGNAMRPLHQRDVGPVGWGLMRDDVTVDVIADLHHLDADMLALVLKVKGPGRVALISDAVPPAGLSEGPYTVWGETLNLSGGCVRNRAGALAGSASLLDEGVTTLRRIGMAPDLARAAASEIPMKVLERS